MNRNRAKSSLLIYGKIVGLLLEKDDLHDKGKIEHTFNEPNMEADEIRHFLKDVL
ncbi:DUF3055 domain-containing protein [Virgibacillus proomii]|uniref:DUF3055 domain-containing protein n=1 Tax=Virgibacillus proomii TaxID=84407 RepID=UPI001C10A033|nr:DUF3055 domain-containing protein [Virgibacillus proomii]MBU5267422.1 DUF3055 domain-containing protein [Virgibacillus proomii]